MKDNLANELNEIKEKASRASIILVTLFPITLIFLIATIMIIQDNEDTGMFMVGNLNFLFLFLISYIVYIIKFRSFSRKLKRTNDKNIEEDSIANTIEMYKDFSKTNLFHILFYIVGAILVFVSVIFIF